MFKEFFKGVKIHHEYGSTHIVATNAEEDITYSSHRDVDIIIDNNVIYVYSISTDNERKLIAASSNFSFIVSKR
jgi:hypothetical protein